MGSTEQQREHCSALLLLTLTMLQVTCRTANSWTEFYDKHYHIIQERYERLIGTITQSNHPEADSGRMNIDP